MDDGYRPFRRASLRPWPWAPCPGQVITHRLSSAEMPAFYSDIYHGKAGSVIGSTVNWEAAR